MNLRMYELELYGILLLAIIAIAICLLTQMRRVSYYLAELEAAEAVAKITGKYYLVRISKEARHEYLLSCYEEYLRPQRLLPYIAYLNMVAHTGDLKVNLR